MLKLTNSPWRFANIPSWEGGTAALDSLQAASDLEAREIPVAGLGKQRPTGIHCAAWGFKIGTLLAVLYQKLWNIDK